jgi:hypothetical protein
MEEAIESGEVSGQIQPVDQSSLRLKIKNEKQVLENIKSDYKDAEKFKEDNDSRISAWMDIYNSRPYGTEKKGKSRYVSSMVRQLVEWQVPSLVEPFTSAEEPVQCSPVTYRDVETAKQAQTLLNYQFTRGFPRFTFLTDLCTTISTEGTCWIKTGWEYEEKEVTYAVEKEVPVEMSPVQMRALQEALGSVMAQAQQNGASPEDMQAIQADFIRSNVPMQIVEEEVSETVVVNNRPTAIICDNKDIRVDPTCRGDLSKASFIIHDWETDLSSLRKDDRYFNLDKLKDKLFRDDTWTERSYVDDTFEFQDDPRKKFIVHEYWGKYDIDGDGIAEDIVMCYVDDIIIRLDENPLDDGTLPFVRAVYRRMPGYIYGEPLASSIGDKQKIDSILNRGIFDDLMRANNGQRGIKKGFTDPVNLKRFKNGLDFEYNTAPGDIWEGKYTGISQSVFEVLMKNKGEAEGITGIKSFDHGGGGNSLGSTAAAVNAVTTSSAKREMQIIRGIAEEAIVPMLRIWHAYNQLFLDDEYVMAITDEEYVTIRRDDLQGNIDIKMSIATQESKALKADRLAFLMQTIGPSIEPEMRNLLMARLVEINDMPRLAKDIMNFEPQIDPMTQKQMELQIALLEAQVENERAKGIENQMDVKLKGAKAANEIAKAKKTSSEADMKDLEFLMEDQGISHERDMQKEAVKQIGKMQKPGANQPGSGNTRQPE